MTIMRTIAPAMLAALVCAPAAQADDVTDAIEEAVAAYEEGDFGYAQESLNFAAQLIAQMKTGTLADLLPDPLTGWEGSEVDTETMGAALFGGGSTATRNYTKESSFVSVQYTADSPLIAQMGAMFSNPAMIGASGGKLLRIGRQKAMIDEDGTIQFMVDNNVMVQIEGNAPEEDKVAYAKSIDLKALKDY